MMAELLINRAGQLKVQALAKGSKFTVTAKPDEEFVTVSARVRSGQEVEIGITRGDMDWTGWVVTDQTRSPAQKNGHSDWAGGEMNFAISEGEVLTAELR